MPSKTEAIYRKDMTLQTYPTSILTVQPLTSLPATSQSLFKGAPEDSLIVTTPATIFHAQGGGQPSDTGSIRSLKPATSTFDVSSARSDANGTILHLGTFSTPDPAFEAGDEVTQEIDAEKRLLHSRFHTAGHVLGLAVRALADEGKLPRELTELKASHFPGTAADEFGGLIPGDAKAGIQAKVDELVSRDLEIKIHFWSEEEARERCAAVMDGVKGEDGIVRICEVDGVGSYPCGGTHVGRTGECGKVVVKGIKRAKGISRVSYEVS